MTLVERFFFFLNFDTQSSEEMRLLRVLRGKWCLPGI